VDISTRIRALLGAVLLAGVTVGVWWTWLGRETVSGGAPPAHPTTAVPYPAWQVAGCVVSLVVVAAVAGWLLSPWLVVPVMTVTFTLAFARWAAAGHDSGLWAFGAILVLVGTADVATLVSGGVRVLRRRHDRRLPTPS
jgi:hypothetical protein